jgi:hypothetical protein
MGGRKPRQYSDGGCLWQGWREKEGPGVSSRAGCPRHSGRNPHDPQAASYRTLHAMYIILAIRVEIHMTHRLLHTVPCM